MVIIFCSFGFPILFNLGVNAEKVTTFDGRETNLQRGISFETFQSLIDWAIPIDSVKCLNIIPGKWLNYVQTHELAQVKCCSMFFLFYSYFKVLLLIRRLKGIKRIY